MVESFSLGATRLLQVDEGFLGRVYRTATIAWVGVGILLAAYGFTGELVSFAIGGGISLAFLRATQIAIQRYVVPRGRHLKKAVVLLYAVKMPVLGVALYLLVGTEWVNVVALAAGLGLVQAVIVLKAMGIALYDLAGRV